MENNTQVQQQPENQIESQNKPQNPTQEKPNVLGEQKSEVKKRAFRIGVIVNGFNLEDIKYYNEQFKRINKLYKEKVRLVFFGYEPEQDNLNALEGVSYEFVKPVSIIHYFKQLKALNIDLLFVPLIQNVFNHTSENYNKYMEVAIYSTPVIAPDIYPYSTIIRDKQNGFIFGNRENFIPYLVDLLSKNIGLIRLCGSHAKEEVLKVFNYSEQNMEIISNIIGFHDENEEQEQVQEQNNNNTEIDEPNFDEDDSNEGNFDENE